MKNVERLARHITKNGSENILIHTIPGTKNWLICQKIETDKWALSLCNPMGNVTYNVGTIDDKRHVQLWKELIKTEIELKASQVLLAKEYKEVIHNFITNYENNYKNFLKKEENTKENKTPKTTKQTGTELRKKLKRLQKSII
jgi:hypothetical protein